MIDSGCSVPYLLSSKRASLSISSSSLPDVAYGFIFSKGFTSFSGACFSLGIFRIFLVRLLLQASFYFLHYWLKLIC